MRGVPKITLLLMAVHFAQCRKTHVQSQEERRMKHNYYSDDQSCVQEEPDCERCLSNNGNCEWCSDGSQRSECIEQGRENCPHGHRKTTCESQTAEDERKEALLDYYDESLDELGAMDAPVGNITAINASLVTVNASVLCGRQGGCKKCTGLVFCLWCESKQECQVHYNATTAERSCPGKHKAYHNQCLFPSKCHLTLWTQ